MEGLFSFLLFAVFFFLMMRFGCGAHMGHGKHKASDKDDEQKHIDPVCGIKVIVDQGYGKMHQGQLYRFCSRDCLDIFDSDPNKYINLPTQNGGVL